VFVASAKPQNLGWEFRCFGHKSAAITDRPERHPHSDRKALKLHSWQLLRPRSASTRAIVPHNPCGQ